MLLKTLFKNRKTVYYRLIIMKPETDGKYPSLHYFFTTIKGSSK